MESEFFFLIFFSFIHPFVSVQMFTPYSESFFFSFCSCCVSHSWNWSGNDVVIYLFILSFSFFLLPSFVIDRIVLVIDKVFDFVRTHTHLLWIRWKSARVQYERREKESFFSTLVPFTGCEAIVKSF